MKKVSGSENGFPIGFSKNQFLGHFSPSFLFKIGNFILRFHLYDGQITQVLFIINLTCSLCVALVWCLSSASGCGCALKCCTGLWFDWGRGSFACWLNGNGLSARPPLHKFPYGPEIVKYIFRSLKPWRFFLYVPTYSFPHLSKKMVNLPSKFLVIDQTRPVSILALNLKLHRT